MNLDTVASPTRADESCSLRSLLTLGCRSRAEAFAKKLQTKLWTLGHMETNGQSDTGFVDHNVHTWVTVEARLDVNNSVVTSVPVVSKVHREELFPRRDESVPRDEEPKTNDLEIWDVAQRSLGRESVDRESDASSTNKLSDSDQYFDFGIDSPLEPEFQAELTIDEEVIVNVDDGLPSQPESGCVFTSPVLSGSDSSDADSEEDTSFYDVESLSQSPANVPGKTLATALEILTLPSAEETPDDLDRPLAEGAAPSPDPNLMENDVEKVVGDKLPSSEVMISKSGKQLYQNWGNPEEENRAAACVERIFCSVATGVASVRPVGEPRQFNDMLPFWRVATTSPAPSPDAIPTINADVPVANTREIQSRGRQQGDLEDISAQAWTPSESAGSVAQSIDEAGEEQLQVTAEPLQLNICLLQSVYSPSDETVGNDAAVDQENTAISSEMGEIFPADNESDQSSNVSTVSCDLFLKVEQLLVSDLEPDDTHGIRHLKHDSESSSGYADSIAFNDNDSNSPGSVTCLSDCESCHSDPDNETPSPQSHEDKDDSEGSAVSQDLPTIELPDSTETTTWEDEDSDYLSRRHRVQRSTSLKTGKTPPGTPGRKKIVRFADALGLDLALVRTYMDEIPNVPQSAFRDLEAAEQLLNDSPDSASNALVGFDGPYPRRQDRPLLSAPTTGFRTLIACFTPPVNLCDFLDRLKNQKVCLETAAMAEDMTIRGAIRCLNIDFHKSVILRVTTDEWLTFTDVTAEYVPDSCDGLSDRFSFTLLAYSLQPGQRVIFAISYRVAGQEFWDNNFGFNYVFQCIAERAANSASCSLLSSPGSSNWMPYM